MPSSFLLSCLISCHVTSRRAVSVASYRVDQQHSYIYIYIYIYIRRGGRGPRTGADGFGGLEKVPVETSAEVTVERPSYVFCGFPVV